MNNLLTETIIVYTAAIVLSATFKSMRDLKQFGIRNIFSDTNFYLNKALNVFLKIDWWHTFDALSYAVLRWAFIFIVAMNISWWILFFVIPDWIIFYQAFGWPFHSWFRVPPDNHMLNSYKYWFTFQWLKK